jgi:hypothetical protein
MKILFFAILASAMMGSAAIAQSNPLSSNMTMSPVIGGTGVDTSVEGMRAAKRQQKKLNAQSFFSASVFYERQSDRIKKNIYLRVNVDEIDVSRLDVDGRECTFLIENMTVPAKLTKGQTLKLFVGFHQLGACDAREVDVYTRIGIVTVRPRHLSDKPEKR